MLQAALNTQFRIAYVSKDETEGLTDVSLYLKAPDDSLLGPYVMTELTDAPFSGTYYYDIVLTQQGYYLASMDSVALPKKAEVSIACFRGSPFASF